MGNIYPLQDPTGPPGGGGGVGGCRSTQSTQPCHPFSGLAGKTGIRQPKQRQVSAEEWWHLSLAGQPAAKQDCMRAQAASGSLAKGEVQSTRERQA